MNSPGQRAHRQNSGGCDLRPPYIPPHSPLFSFSSFFFFFFIHRLFGCLRLLLSLSSPLPAARCLLPATLVCPHTGHSPSRAPPPSAHPSPHPPRHRVPARRIARSLLRRSSGDQRGIRWTQGSSGRCRCACAHAPVLRRRQRVLPAGGQSRGTLARKGAALSGAERSAA
ncbi:hypothetical protein T492DRAFT_223406 [Pavlovales sp. CCMP2436]|nr:hypothetical protein T492DRAFT_223406 [Pavlovales sp. CCMP2436]